MARLTWGDKPPVYDRGLDRGVLYLGESALPWNGLVSVDEEETGAVDATHYFDGNRIHISQHSSAFRGSLSAYTYPEPLEEYDGYSHRDTYRRFGFSYRTQRGSEHQIHLVYQALIAPKVMQWDTLTDRADPSLFSWNIRAEEVPVPGSRPTAHLVVDTRELSWVAETIEDILYGTDTTDPRMPNPEELIEIYEAATSLRITYHEDGSYTVEGDDSLVEVLPDGMFRINSPSVEISETGRFTVRSLA